MQGMFPKRPRTGPGLTNVTSQLQQLKSLGKSPRQVSQSPNAVPTVNPNLNGIPQPVSNVRVSTTANGSLWDTTVTFLHNPFDPNARSYKVWLKGYKGNSDNVQVGVGSLSPIKFSLEATGEPVMLVVQSSGNTGDTLLTTAPSTSITL